MSANPKDPRLTNLELPEESPPSSSSPAPARETPKGPTADAGKGANNLPPEPIDLERLRLPQNFQQFAGVRRVFETIPVRKPHPQEFVRVRPGNEWTYETLVLPLKTVSEMYLVAPDLWDTLHRELTQMHLVLAANAQDDVFVWPCRIPRGDGRLDTWAESRLIAVGKAERKFIRLIPNVQQGI